MNLDIGSIDIFVKNTKNIGSVWSVHLNNSFQYLNNITCIFTNFFTCMYFQKIQTTLLE